jgi:hypothetical protein
LFWRIKSGESSRVLHHLRRMLTPLLLPYLIDIRGISPWLPPPLGYYPLCLCVCVCVCVCVVYSSQPTHMIHDLANSVLHSWTKLAPKAESRLCLPCN